MSSLVFLNRQKSTSLTPASLYTSQHSGTAGEIVENVDVLNKIDHTILDVLNKIDHTISGG